MQPVDSAIPAGHTTAVGKMESFAYDNSVVKKFIIASVIFGIVGMLVGLIAAIQLYYPVFNFNLQYTTYGRIRPLYTNAVIFAFVDNAMFAGDVSNKIFILKKGIVKIFKVDYEGVAYLAQPLLRPNKCIRIKQILSTHI